MLGQETPGGDTPLVADRTLRVRTPAEAYRRVRAFTEALCEPLGAEDCVVQSMPDASPAKWHLAHTTWFFEAFILSRLPDHRPFDPRFGYLFNSYYEAAGPRQPRPTRGLLSRPTLDEVRSYRAHVDRRVLDALAAGLPPDLSDALELGIHHEQQHQELLLTDAKHALGTQPLRPAYREAAVPPAPATAPLGWHERPGGPSWLGFSGPGFSFDNERPRHRVLLAPHALASRLATNGEYLAFMDDGGYRRPELWLSDGWEAVRARGWQAPLYWELQGGRWWLYSLAGMRGVDEAEPVVHVSFYEAEAFARWAGARLPTEAEWEAAAADARLDGTFVECGRLHPAAAPAGGAGPRQLFGDCWEWTRSAYEPYPGFVPFAGGLGEYNGKFMVNQIVLRGGSCATPTSHVRASYRNFFPPDARWQFSGVRLARDILRR